MKDYGLIKEAQERYPIGTRVVCLCDKLEYTVGDFDHNGSDDGDVWCTSTDGWGVQLCKDFVWTDTVVIKAANTLDLNQIKPMFLLFVRWCMDGYYTMSEADVWIPSDYGLSKDSVNWKTTEELFELWLEERTKPIYQQIIDTVGGEESFCKLAGIKQTKK